MNKEIFITLFEDDIVPMEFETVYEVGGDIVFSLASDLSLPTIDTTVTVNSNIVLTLSDVEPMEETYEGKLVVDCCECPLYTPTEYDITVKVCRESLPIWIPITD